MPALMSLDDDFFVTLRDSEEDKGFLGLQGLSNACSRFTRERRASELVVTSCFLSC